MPTDDQSTPGADPPTGTDRPLTVRSEDLLQGRKELWIEHQDEIYRLRLTPTGKLYLTK